MVKVISMSNCKCLTVYQQVLGGPLTNWHSCFNAVGYMHTMFVYADNNNNVFSTYNKTHLVNYFLAIIVTIEIQLV